MQSAGGNNGYYKKRMSFRDILISAEVTNEQLKKYFWNYHIAVCGNSNVNFVTGSDADNVVEP